MTKNEEKILDLIKENDLIETETGNYEVVSLLCVFLKENKGKWNEYEYKQSRIEIVEDIHKVYRKFHHIQFNTDILVPIIEKTDDGLKLTEIGNAMLELEMI